MKAAYYDKASNAVFLRGALNPVNPQTNEYWTNEQEALAFIATLPTEPAPLTPVIVIKAVSGIDVDYVEGVINLDAGVTLTVEIEIQNQGLAIQGLNRVFRVPVDRDGQQGVKVLKLAVIDGVGRFVTRFDSGEFFINEKTINRRLSSEEFIAMDKPLHIVVVEAEETAELIVEVVTPEATIMETVVTEDIVTPVPEVAALAKVIAPAETNVQVEAVASTAAAVTEAVSTKETVAPAETSALAEEPVANVIITAAAATPQ